MTIALIGDLHLSMRSPRYRHTLEVLDWALADATARGATAVVLLGDLFEGRPTPEEYRDLAARIVAHGLPADVLLGNHEDYHALSWLPFLRGDVRIADGSIYRISYTGVDVLAVPYPRRGRPPFEAAGTGGPRESADVTVAVISTAIERCKAPGVPLAVVGHFTVEGMATRDAEFEVHGSREVVVPIAALAGADLVATGHIHRAQVCSIGDVDVEAPGGFTLPVVGVGPTVVSVGGLVRHSFAESSDGKFYGLLRAGNRLSLELVPVPARAMIEVEFAWTAGTDRAAVRAKLPPETVAGKEVKVMVAVRGEDLATFRRDAFTDVESVAAAFFLSRVVSQPRRARAEVRAGASDADVLGLWLDGAETSADQRRRVVGKVESLSEEAR